MFIVQNLDFCGYKRNEKWNQYHYSPKKFILEYVGDIQFKYNNITVL